MKNVIALKLVLLCASTFLAHGAYGAQMGTKWQHTLTSSKSYGNPFRDVTVRVTLTAPSGRTLETRAFWDGGDKFHMRAAFDETGAWTWRTTSSDTNNSGLHNRSGKLSVTRYMGSNPLVRHGRIRVSADGTHLAHRDGTPFMWLFDTAWPAITESTMSQWKNYIDNRAAKGFTGVQFSFPASWSSRDVPTGEKAFTSNTCVKWQPRFWQYADQMIDYANSKGLAILFNNIAAPLNASRYTNVTDTTMRVFARNLAARYSANHVMYAPTFDSKATTTIQDHALRERYEITVSI